MDLAQLVVDRKDEIVARFVVEVQRAAMAPPGLTRTLIADHIPKFLVAIGAQLTAPKVAASTADAHANELARRHGEQRWSLGYDLDGLIREYGVLRRCILAIAVEAGIKLLTNEFDALGECLNAGIAEAANEYAKFRDAQFSKQKSDLEFLVSAGTLLSTSLDYRRTLNHLTQLLVPRMADWCSIYLAEGNIDDIPVAHVDPDKVSLLRELYRLHPAGPEATRGHLHVAKTGEKEFVPDANQSFLEQVARSPEHLALINRIKVTSWIIVPLIIHDHPLGALTLAYGDSDRVYGEDDLFLATELARRAAAAIDNAQLYELSQQARSRVEVATRAKDEFVAMVSHELRTPMSVVLGWARMIRAGEVSPDKVQHALEVIERNADAQSRLISDLLDISRVITGKIRINLSEVDVSNVVDAAVESARFAADPKRIKLNVSLDRDQLVVRADADRLQQVIGNLLSNAIKFTPKDGVVRVGLARVGPNVELTVEDNGAGIGPAFLPHVFESFRQEDGGIARKHGGLGIGLSISKHLIELHGGTIEALSAGPGTGAKFVVRLPVGPPVAGAVSASQTPATVQETSRDSAPSLRGVRVLVVDDERDARELIAFVLENSAAEVRMAASAEDAIHELDSFTPHVIISDIGMPGEDGYSLIRKIRTLAADDKKNVPAVALTAFARNEDRTRALVEGFNVHLTKPIEPKQLVRVVLDLVGTSPNR